MKIIEKLTDMIDEELHDAEKYALCAQKYGDEYPELAQTFLVLSREEMRHKDMLHEQVVKIIAKHRAEHGEPPAAMKAVYDYLHQKAVDRAAEITRLQERRR